VDFSTASKILEAQKNTERRELKPDFYKHLERNKKAFDGVMMSAEESARIPTGTSHESKLIKRIKATIHKPELTDDDEDYLQAVLDLIRDGKLPKFTITKVEKVSKMILIH